MTDRRTASHVAPLMNLEETVPTAIGTSVGTGSVPGLADVEFTHVDSRRGHEFLGSDEVSDPDRVSADVPALATTAAGGDRVEPAEDAVHSVVERTVVDVERHGLLPVESEVDPAVGVAQRR